MRLELAYVSEEFIYPALVRCGARAFIASGPFAEHACSVPVLFHDFRQDDVVGTVWLLSRDRIVHVHPVLHHRGVCPVLLVPPYMPVSGVLPGHERCPGGGAYRTSCIGLCKTHPFPGHPVYVRGADVFLPVAGQVTVPHVVAHDVDDIGLLSLCAGGEGGHQAAAAERYFRVSHELLFLEVI